MTFHIDTALIVWSVILGIGGFFVWGVIRNLEHDVRGMEGAVYVPSWYREVEAVPAPKVAEQPRVTVVVVPTDNPELAARQIRAALPQGGAA